MILTPQDSPLTTPANFAVGATSPLATTTEQSLLTMLAQIAGGGSESAGFNNSQPGIANTTVGNMNLGPQAGLNKSLSDLANTANTFAGLGRGVLAGPLGTAVAVARSPIGRGLMANIANMPAFSTKANEFAARGNQPALGGAKGESKPDSLSDEEAAAQAAAAAATNDMGGTKGDPGSGGGKGDAAGTGAHGENSSPGTEGKAAGGLIELAGGGKIARGPGGGMDDLIPTTIEGARAAALSDGEFVIPADVVSMLGDGSTNAGSKRLYDLMRQIRELKTGRDRQAPPIQFTEILRRALG